MEKILIKTVKSYLLVSYLTIFGTPLLADQLEEKFRDQATQYSEIAVFKNLDEYDLPRPPRTQKFLYNPEYLKTIHIPGWPGYPYEVSMTFRFEKDTWKPSASESINRRQIEVNVRGGWTTASQDLKNMAYIPQDVDLMGSMITLEQNAVDRMQKVAFTNGRNSKEIDDLELDFNEKNDVFVLIENKMILYFMICQRAQKYRSPHCIFRIREEPLTIKARFHRDLLEEFVGVRDQASRFVSYLMVE